MEMNKAGIWIKLALSDLKASRLLYEQKQFRTSYFLFQQSTEKANKAFALKFGLAEEEDLKGMGHNQFKLERRFAARKIEELNRVFIEPQEITPELEKKHKDLKEGLSALDSLRNQNLVNLSSTEINSLYEGITRLKIPFKKRVPPVKKILQDSGDLKPGYLLALGLIQWRLDVSFIRLSISACSILTEQHSTLTRYPEQGKDPTKIYTLRLPIVKKQPLFMNLLEEVIDKMKKHSDEKILKKLYEDFSRSMENNKKLDLAHPKKITGK
jgi:HEPN domain-containing protein